MTILVKNVKKADGKYGKLLVKLKTNSQQRNVQTYDGNSNLSICCCVTTIFFIIIIILGALCYYNDVRQQTTSLIYPPKLSDIPNWWYHRGEHYGNHLQRSGSFSHDFKMVKVNQQQQQFPEIPFQTTDEDNQKKLVCYYAMPDPTEKFENLQLRNIDPHLCTHINIGIVNIIANSLAITPQMVSLLNETKYLRSQNPKLKFLIWTGGVENQGFISMVLNHSNRKSFIRSLKYALREYELDGIDLDWEFPSPYNKERQHFSQLLQEIRREYKRERRNYILTVAAAAVEGIAYYAYDIPEINKYADFVNIMTYDYHFYSRSTPFTGINAPLYARSHEGGVLGILNLNYSLHYWHTNGLDKNKIVVGLPTYGHTFRLVNPFNHEIVAPASGFGNVGKLGFASFSEICWFKQNNIYVTTVFDQETCSPYLYSVNEWISFENQQSLECKSKFIRDQGYGGAMLFSLNTDDFNMLCNSQSVEFENDKPQTFPLIRKVKSILFQ